MKKFKLYWDKDKEEQWINEMVTACNTDSIVIWGFTMLILLFAVILGNVAWKSHNKMRSLE